MSQNLWNFFEDADLSGSTLILPSIAVGNVGQLACDLLISSLNMTKIATVYSPAFIPVLGYDPYDLKSSTLSGSCELYKCSAKNLIVLQLRAPLVFKYARTFLAELVEKAKEKNMKDIIVLSSSFAHERKHILTSPFRYAASDLCPYRSTIEDLKWVKHELVEDRIQIHGGGFSSILYEICKDKAVPCLVLYKYCSEGDNIPDAYDMILQLKSILSLCGDHSDLLSQLVQPVSWKLLFGRPPPQDIY
ncbi:Proteasome assembly chaperone 2 [Operophtera brumata]|uniref:Proteasome assembly chaperone 2 n=1 Tax=Operophtera brumata TaxID=104452 RepID=A0A0L7LM37_OPEBR|nr:Proteasome assembly chaperone 2 [Operophtera brumata]